jgi:hypothetical protein
VQVTDDVMVASVQVMVLDERGNAAEKGDWWEYVPTAEDKMIVEARDLAGNVVKAEL